MEVILRVTLRSSLSHENLIDMNVKQINRSLGEPLMDNDERLIREEIQEKFCGFYIKVDNFAKTLDEISVYTTKCSDHKVTTLKLCGHINAEDWKEAERCGRLYEVARMLSIISTFSNTHEYVLSYRK
jgi:hypothetical protein